MNATGLEDGHIGTFEPFIQHMYIVYMMFGHD